MSQTQLELQVVSESQAAIDALNDLEEALRGVQNAISDGLKDYEDFTKDIQEFSNALDEAISDDTVEKYENLANSLTTLQVISKMSFDSSGIAGFAEEINEIASGLNQLDLINIALKTVGPAIGQTLGNVLGHFFSSGAETIETVWNITTNINGDSIDNKTDGWMIDDLLIPAIGSTLAGDLRNQIMADGTGSVEVPVTFTISATSSITAVLSESASGITLDDIQDAAWRSFMAGLSPDDKAFGKSFSISDALTGEGAMVDTGLLITGKVSLAVALDFDGGISWENKNALEKDIQAFVDKETFDVDINVALNGSKGDTTDTNEFADFLAPYLISEITKLLSFGVFSEYDFVKAGGYIDDISSLYGLDQDQYNSLADNYVNLVTYLKDGIISTDEFQNALTLLVESFSKDTTSMEEMARTSETLSQDITTSAEDAHNAVQEAIENIESIEVASPDISGFTSGMYQMMYAASSAVSSIKSSLRSLNGISVSFSSGLLGGFTSIRMAASGGQFDSGEVFVARENGIPEMIGQIGNKATVANNDQIVAGISSGVASGQAEQNALLRRQNDILIQLLNKKFTAEVFPSAALGKTVRRSEEMYERNAGV